MPLSIETIFLKRGGKIIIREAKECVAYGLAKVATMETTNVKRRSYCCCPPMLVKLTFGEGGIWFGYYKDKK